MINLKNMKNKTLLEGFIHLRPENRIYLLKTSIDQTLTIAYKLKETTSGSKLLIGISVCSKKDQFCKRTGRNIAYDRMSKRPYKTEKFAEIDTSVFKSTKGRRVLHKFIFDNYITNTSANQIKEHIYAIS